MPGMMRNRKSIGSCPCCCTDWLTARAREARDWHREEWRRACAPVPTPGELYELARDLEDDAPFWIDFGTWAQLHQEGVPTLEEVLSDPGQH